MKKQLQQAVPFCVRQGDVLLVEAAYRGDKSEAGEIVRSVESRPVLAYGEVTGHAHRIAEPKRARLLDHQAERYLQVVNEATLRHEEHGAVVLHEGRYQQAFQVEELGEEVRQVAD